MTVRTCIKFRNQIRNRKKPSKSEWQIPYIGDERMQTLCFASLLVVGLGSVMKDMESCFVSNLDVKKSTKPYRQRQTVVIQQSDSLSYSHGRSKPRKEAFRGTKH